MKKHVTLDNLKTFLDCCDDRFIQQEAGKGLSTNDFTDTYKERIKSIDYGAEKNIITAISVDGDELSITPGRTAVVEVVTEDDIKQLAKEVNEGIGGDADFETATDNDIYSIVHS